MGVYKFKLNMKYLAIIIAVLILTPAYGQRKKKDDEITVPLINGGIVYALPRTVVKVNVFAKKETFEPGPYRNYADQLLGIKDVRAKAETRWIITGVSIETYSEPDPAHVYKAMGDVAALVSLLPNGCLAGINTIAVEEPEKKVYTNNVGQENHLGKDYNFSYFTDTPFFSPGDSTNNFRPVRVGVDQKVAEAAQRVLDARRYQFDMVSGMMDEFHPDGVAYELSMKALKKVEEDYLSLFVGKSTIEKGVFSFDYIPGSSPGRAEAVFRISEENGIVPAGDLSGKPVMIEFETDNNLLQRYNTEAKSSVTNELGVFYRMPGVATIKIINDLKVIATARATIAQFGPVASVPADLLYGNYAIEFHPETGAIKSIVTK